MKRSQGFSLVELMIAMVLGLSVMAALFGFFQSNLRASNTALEMSRLNQELQTVMGMVTRDIRRAGYRADASDNRMVGDKTFMFLPGEFVSGTWIGQDVGLLQPGGVAGAGPYGCITLKADLNDSTLDDDTDLTDGLDADEIHNYQFNAAQGQVEFQSGAAICGESWPRLTSRQIQITRFDVALDPAVEPDGSRLMQTVMVRLQGQLRSNPGIRLGLEQQVRLRNNVY